MLDSPKTQAQSDSVAYMNYIAQHTQGDIVGGGHSKGGNDFEYAYLFCDEEAKNRIKKGYVYDSPGLNKKILSKTDRYNDYKRITDGSFICPEESVIGQLLQEADNAKFVKSTAHDGFSAHEPGTWLFDYDEKTGKWSFSYGEQSDTSKNINELTDIITNDLSPEERELVLDFLTYLLYATGETSVNDILKKIGGKTAKNKLYWLKLIYDEMIASGYWDTLSPSQKLRMQKIIGKALGYTFVFVVWPWIKEKMGHVGDVIDAYEKFRNKVYKEIAEIAGPYIKKAIDVFKGIHNYAMKAIKSVCKYFKDKFNKGKKYAKTHTEIKIDTHELYKYADDLTKINGRLIEVEEMLHKLYFSLSPVNQQRLQAADKDIGTSPVILRCQKYLRETADLFAEAEAKIVACLR